MLLLRKIGLLCLAVILLSGCSNAHILVLDQHDDPVEGVLIHSNIQPGNAFFSQSETTAKYTDKAGKMTLPVGKWFRLMLVRKEGYQFRETVQFKQEFGGDIFGSSAEKFTAESPLVIRGWKRGEQAELTYIGGKVVFPDDIEQCTLELIQPNEKNALTEPLVLELKLETTFKQKKWTDPVEIYYDADKWSAELAMSGAELQDTDDLFLNEAPEIGYQNAISYPSEEFPGNYAEKYIFIKDQSNKYFGGGLLFFNADRGTKGSLDEVNNQIARFQIWLNFDGSTNIMRTDKQTTWRALEGHMDKSFHCRESLDYW